MHFRGQVFDALAERLGQFSQAGVLFEQFQQLRGVLRRLCLSLTVGGRQRFTMLGIGRTRLIPRRR
jgi:hypothetical protein